MTGTSKPVEAYKFHITKEKSITIRMPRISDSRLAAQICGRKCAGNDALLQMSINEELLKMVLLEVNDKKVDEKSKLNLDSLFSVLEYNRALLCLQKVSGDDESEGNFQPEIVTTGS